MANVKITALTGISSADVTNEDVFVVVDLSEDETKKITLANIIAAVDTTQLSNVVALQGGLTGSNVRITSEEANVIALQGGLAGANSNQVAIATFADDTGVWQAGNLIPKANGVYSLGAADALWKDVFISAGSIKLGGVTISAADDEGITIAGASGDTTSIVTPTAGGAANVSANIAFLESNVTILLGSTAGQNTRIAAEEANVINLQSGLAGANTALTNEISATNVDVTNLVSGIGGSNSRIAAEEANVIALQSGISGSNSRIVAEEANVIALQAGLTGANTNISSNDTDITNLVTGLGGSNTNITALEARRAANTSIFLGAFTGSNTRLAAEEANVIALQGGIDGVNTAIASNDTDIAALEARRAANTAILLGAHSGANTRIAAEEANVIALQGGIDGANSAISSNDTDITNLVTGLQGANTTIATKASTSYVDTQIAALVDSAPETLDTLNELAAALGDDANFSTTITNSLATKDSVANVYATYLVAKGGIDGANTNIASNDTDITNLVTGLDGSNTTIATKDSVANVYATYLVAKGGIDGANAAISSNDTDITNLVTGLEGANTTIATKDSVANVYATYLVAKGGIDGANTNISSNDTDITNLVTGLDGSNTTIATKDSVANVYATYLVAKGGIEGANTNITAVEARRTANIAGAVSSITTSDLTASRALTSDGSGKVAVSAVTATELGYLDGVTSAIQTQLDTKLEGNQTIILSGDVSGSGTTSITVTVADDSHNHVISNIDNLQTSLDEKDTVANVYATYLVAKGGIDGANSAISSNDTDITNLVTGLGGSNTNITALEARRAANTAILLGAHSGANARIAAEEANVIALQGGIASANTAIGLRATTASPTFTGIPAAPTAAAGTSTTQIATTAFVGTAVANIVDSAPEALNTLNELAAALGDDANFSTTVSTQIGTISSNTVTNATNITAVEARRVANIAGAVSSITTSDLTASRALVSDGSGKVAVSAVTSTELGYLDGVTSAIQTQLDGKQASGSYLTGNQTITLSGDVSGSGTTAITVIVADDSHNHVISNIDNLQTTLDSKDTVANVYATYLVAKGGIDGANTNITAVEARRTANIAGAVSSITTGNLTASRALVSDGSGKVAVSAVTSTELGYLDGVASNIQTQLNARLPLSGGTMTGNIVMSGAQTVDGRDLSVDGTKLDGIESGATADQTASEILTAIKTVDGTGSGLDADLWDGNQFASYLNQAVLTSSSPTFAGLTVDTDTLYVDATNNRVGIGTSSPALPLHISSATPAIRLTDTDDNSDAQVGAAAGGLLVFDADIGNEVAGSAILFRVDGSSEKMRIDSSGNVGIGTSSVSASTKLEVYGNSAAAHVGIRANNAAANGYATLWLSNAGDNTGIIRGGASAAAFANQLAMLTGSAIPITFSTNNTERMRIDSSGNVGIGAAPSGGKLYVAQGADGQSAGFRITHGSGDARMYINANIPTLDAVAGGGWNFSIAGAEKMRIDSSGNVGINTTSGNEKLNVHGAIGSSSPSAAFGAGLERIIMDYTGSVARVGHVNGASGSAKPVTFLIGGAEKMRIDSSGNVGIGTSAPSSRLEISSAGDNTNVIVMSQGSGYKNSIQNLHSGSASNARMSFFVHDSATTQANVMSLLGNGNVGIGTVSPGTALEVNGTVNASNGKLQEGGNALIPAGFIGMWGAAAAPSGWYLCEGGAISRTTYAALFAAIGTTYGAGDGSTTFNVPDFRDRAPYGASTYTLGSKTGTEIDGSAQAATASGGPTTHSVTTSTTNSTTDKDVTNSITVVTGVSAHASHSHTVTYPAVAVKFIIKT